MTPEQLATIKAAILADPVLAPLTLSPVWDYQEISNVMSAVDPAFYVWRKHVPREEFEEDDAFNWTVVDNLSTGSKYRIWEWMFGSKEYINPSKANIRAGIAACWVGNAQLLAVQAMVLAKCKRKATRVEKLLADTTSGNGSVGTPAAPTYEGGLSVQEVAGMFNA